MKAAARDCVDMSSDGRTELVEADPETQTFRATYRYPSNPPSMAVVAALMSVTGSEITDLDPMYEVASVDPDALDDMFRATGRDRPHRGRVTFTYHDYRVSVMNYGRIVIRSLDDE